MSVSISIYNNTNSITKTLNFDFSSNILAHSGGTDNSLDYYFTLKTGARDQEGLPYGYKVMRDLSTFPLNTKRRILNSNAAYNSVTEMVTDWVYDYVHGHAANLYGSGVTERTAMRF